MSDSDDTDLLLLIPPDFFLVQSDLDLEPGVVERRDPREVEREVVSDLISQVNDLESRICAIENSSEDSRNDPYPGSPHKRLLEGDKVESPRRVNSTLDYRLKDKTIYTLSDMASPTKYVEPLRASDDSLKWTKQLDLPQVDKLLKEMETTQAEIENKLRQREKEFGTKGLVREVEQRLGDGAGSVPDLGFGLKDLLYESARKDKDTDPKQPVVEEPCIRKKVTLLEANPAGMTGDTGDAWKAAPLESRGPADGFTKDNPRPSLKSGLLSPERRFQRSPRRRLHVGTESLSGRSLKGSLEHELAFGERAGLMKSQPSGVEASQPPAPGDDVMKRSGDQYMLRSGEKLLSLNQLWQDSGDHGTDNPLRLQQKLEEEKYRRLHLEQTVQRLQKKVLEEQERVAVAVRVDSEKDRAIGRMTEGWRQMVAHWKTIEEQRHQAAQALLKEKITSKKLQEDVGKKIERWEKEVSQALDLAASFKNKCQTLEVELSSTRGSLNGRIAELEVSLRGAEQRVQQLEEERKQLATRLQISEEEHEKITLTEHLDNCLSFIRAVERKLVNDARKDLAEVEDALGRTEAELAVCKEQRDLLSTRLKEERGRNTTLEQQKVSLQESLEQAMAKQVKAEEDARSAVGQLDTVKCELRALYQGQLESVVKEKLGEFQAQLDSAQAAMQKELADQQRLSQERALQQQQALVNSHVAEMRRLESIHKEELRELELKLRDAEKRCARLENGKKDIAQRLHSLMEAQWQQALSIITSELSIRQAEPEANSKRKDNRNTDKVGGRDEPPNRYDGGPQKLRVDCGGKSDIGGSSGQLTYRVNSPVGDAQTQKQDQLMKYIQMLLDKQPGHPVDSVTSSALQDMSHSDTNIEDTNGDILKWNDMLKPHGCQKEGSTSESRFPNGRSKPPWK